jgi:Zn-dependent peptidase ImmA (M78 family)/transcriptional regulator with XRE-family HTH domain
MLRSSLPIFHPLPTQPVPRVNPDILRWARETAGLTPEEAAHKVDLADTKKASAVERIAALEAGTVEPSRSLLLRMAKQYRRPLITFYLPAPPRKGERGQDFRVLPADHDESDEVLLDALLRDVQSRQSLVRAALEDEDELKPLKFVGSLDMERGVGPAVELLRSALALRLENFRSQPDPEEAFRVLRERAEQLGVYVLLLGNLGSHHTALSLETFRGFAIADPIAPFVVLNDQDSRAAWSFSLIHELTHIWLGQTGVSGGAPDRGIERFCNEVAAEYLLPTAELVQRFRAAAPGIANLESWIGELAATVKVSRTMIAYRLRSQDLITLLQFETLRRQYRDQWLANRDRRRQRARENPGGPTFYVVRRQRLGHALLSTTYRLLVSGAMTTSKSAKVLGVKPTQVAELLSTEAARLGAG